MKRIEREKKPYDFGSGSGIHIYESNLFSVIHWLYEKGRKTELEIKYLHKVNDYEIYFDGFINLKSDKACFEQLTVTEIKDMLKGSFQAGIRKGKNLKIKEIKKCFKEE